MADLEIIGVPFSNFVRSLRMLCEEKGVTCTHTSARPQSPEVLAIHPAGQVPVMRHGDIALFESKAIATYIDKAFPGPKFIPEDALGAALVEQWVSYTNTKVDRWIMREFVVPSAFFDKAKGPDTARISAALPEIDKCMQVVDRAVAETGYLAGGRLSYADMNIVPMLATAMLYPAAAEVVSAYSGIGRYLASLTARPSYVNTAPPPRR
jgi:glutathione S-transferase